MTSQMKKSSIRPFPSEMEFIRYALDSAAIVAITDVRGTITFANNKFCEISGYARNELVGSNHRMLHSGIHDRKFFRQMYRRIAAGQVWQGEICNRRKDGTHYWVDTTIVPHVNSAGKVDSYTAIRFDITARHSADEKLRYIVNIDALTGIANRRRFQEYLETVIANHVASDASKVHLALLDIDSFKEINDTFGHDVGDDLLRVVSGRLCELTSEDVFVARLGGDEFGIVMTGLDDRQVHEITGKVLSCLRQPVNLGPVVRRCSASIGIATFPDQAGSLDELFKASDLSLYRAKELGRDRVQFFVPRLREVALRKSELIHAFETGLAQGQFRLFYQPIIATNQLLDPALEGLLRWEHPQHGHLAPGAFLSEMNDPGLMAALGMFVLEQVFADMQKMQEMSLPLRRVAINVTNADFRSDAFVDRFFELVEETGLPPQKFCIEVTEGVFLGRDFQQLEGRLHRLHSAGVEIALDDFGTGFASLSHLRHMPIDRVKIDRSFISNLGTSSADLAIVRGVIDIAHGMGKAVTAEGVETEHQVEILTQLGCDSLQGWYFAKACNLLHLPFMMASLKSYARDRMQRHAAAS